jgi:hypothetical protein
MTNPEETQNLKEEIEKALTAMKDCIKEGDDAVTNQKAIQNRELYQQFAEMFGQEQADELLNTKNGIQKFYSEILYLS